MDGAGHQLLAGAVLAVDEDAAVRGRRDGDLLAQLLDERALADDLLAALDALPQLAVLPLEAGVLEGARSTTSSVFSRESGFSMKS